ncbi:hypothetical protein COS54_02145 [Candidatus Shapirobacteria bacterium CG03_land_8_20_14_0_80_39_12]|uniref:Bacterial spore germination immunoglobulin-like domain-containing protein n=1 Tax=Candidatus Shapirobacteria bacterium CG03_land_8_20_14_0_80_39_12 TaxID=1974879 RepID=A0A2M7BCP9_9BACT|nr:MAG: hypothetical protein COS54_02145 [Candidatus Shapirobacteria bacterium CG03_land_8_20_14_0_80_39_12]
MKKEVILAIVIGFGVGLMATFGIFNAQKSLNEAGKIQTPQASEEENKPTAGPIATQTLALSAPADQSIIKEGKVAVSGTTTPQSWVIIMGEKGEKVLQADLKGNFETEMLLVSGENEIEVQAISEIGEKISKIVTVVFSTVEI